MQNGAAILESSLPNFSLFFWKHFYLKFVIKKIEHEIIVLTSSCICGHLSQRNENLYSHKSVYSNFVHNSPKVETTQVVK